MIAPDWLRSGAAWMLRAGILAGALYIGWLVQGWRLGADVATLKGEVATANAAAANARADQAVRVLEAERKAHDGMQAVEDRLTKERDAAKNEKDAFIAGVRSGAIRLSVPVVGPVPAGAVGADSAAAGGAGKEARAELAPAAAEFLDDIAGEGDDGIRQANAIIDAYEAVRKALNVQTAKSE
ncbi:lysis system i-spanin subunit Rz [Herbaspirillum chlorophenolicum]|uniref:Lysis system i-spanin subunit Rz n=1 Tax=Herbaspirillum chlorophenolicum TaxID=211589 RepID=A0ABW8F102_9BURK